MILIESDNHGSVVDATNPIRRGIDLFSQASSFAKKRKLSEKVYSQTAEYGRFSTNALWKVDQWLSSDERYDGEPFPETWSNDEQFHAMFLKHMYRWGMDLDTVSHLDPPLYSIEVNDPHPETSGMRQILNYYLNKQEDFDPDVDPLKLTTFWAKHKSRPVGVATLRWRGDPFMQEQPIDVASFERLIVAPDARRNGVGIGLSSKAVEYAFDNGMREVRAWIMTDEQAEPWAPNFYLFRKLGFQTVTGDEVPHWREYAAERNIESYGRDALWLYVTKENYDNSPYSERLSG